MSKYIYHVGTFRHGFRPDLNHQEVNGDFRYSMTLPCQSRLSQVLSRQPVFSGSFTKRYASNWAHNARFPSFFTPTPIARYGMKRRALLLIPLAGGIALYLTPQQTSVIPTLISSPVVIPCRSSEARPIILSPSEDLIIGSRIVAFLRDKIWEPILTARRFITLCFIFLPVIFTSPMLLVGKPRKKYNGEGWGAIWWYNFLVRRMETAGPTFIKVYFETSF